MIKVLIAGDFVPPRHVAAKIEKGDYTCLKEVICYAQNVDYAIVNLESPILIREAKPIEKTGPNLFCRENTLACLKYNGFNCITLANNHFRDFGQTGVEDTISACKKYNIDYVGGGLTLKDASQILYKVFNNQTLSIINASEHEWSIATNNRGGSNPLNIIPICHSIQEAKQKSQFVLVIIHGGTESYRLPTPRMKELYRFFIEQGADAVINHHQHCYSGFEIYKEKPIFYGLGNFLFNKNSTKEDVLWESGFFVELEFGEKIGYKLHPYKQCHKGNLSVQMLNNSDSFFSSIEQINHIISNDTLLCDSFEKMAAIGTARAKNILTPYTFKLLKRMQSKGLFPSFVNNNRLLQLLANIQCESHRDILICGLETKV